MDGLIERKSPGGSEMAFTVIGNNYGFYNWSHLNRSRSRPPVTSSKFIVWILQTMVMIQARCMGCHCLESNGSLFSCHMTRMSHFLFCCEWGQRVSSLSLEETAQISCCCLKSVTIVSSHLHGFFWYPRLPCQCHVLAVRREMAWQLSVLVPNPVLPLPFSHTFMMCCCISMPLLPKWTTLVIHKSMHGHQGLASNPTLVNQQQDDFQTMVVAQGEVDLDHLHSSEVNQSIVVPSGWCVI